MVPLFWLSTCLLAALLAQDACGARGKARRRVKRAWVIPPISLPENHRRLPHLLVQIKSDKQQPGVVVYSIKGPGVDEDPKDIFSIDNRSGKVYLNTVLDREKHDRFRLKAFALDLGGAPLEDPTDLEIVVLDQNDNRPLFQRDVFTGHVAEGAEPGTFVLKAEATDADDPETDNAELRFSILGPEGAELFAINELSGEIQVAGDGLDREVTGSYNLTLQVADMAGEGLATTATAAIYVEDVNDNPPEFMSDEFHLEAPENRQGLEVGRVTVQDEDQRGSSNWLAKFTILEGDPRGAFSIHPDPLTNEGVISLVKALDYEEQNRYELLVSVQNQSPLHPSAPKAAHALATVQLQVVDANEAPFFLDNPCRGRVNEGAAAGTEVALLRARDPDTQRAQPLRYLQASEVASWLQVDPESGRVEAHQKVPPRSTFLGGWYITQILAVDNGTPPLTATGTLSVEVLEVNDHPPSLFPTTGSLCREGGGLVLSATDQDLAPHAGPFHFRIGLSSAHNWTLRQPNGTHVLLQPPVDVDEGLHLLPLLVRDSGIPPRVREQLLNVSICACSQWGTCGAQAAATLGARAGLSLGAMLAVLCSAVLLLLLVLLVAGLEHSRRQALRKGLLGAWQDDLRDNIVNYDEQGGGEEDQVRPGGLPTPTISPSCVTPISFGPRPPVGSPFGGGMPPTATPCPSTHSDALPTSRTSSTRAWRQPTVIPASPRTTRLSSTTTRGPVRPAGPSAPSCPAWETKTRTTTTSTNGAHDSSAWLSCMASRGQEEQQGRTGQLTNLAWPATPPSRLAGGARARLLLTAPQRQRSLPAALLPTEAKGRQRLPCAFPGCRLRLCWQLLEDSLRGPRTTAQPVSPSQTPTAPSPGPTTLTRPKDRGRLGERNSGN